MLLPYLEIYHCSKDNAQILPYQGKQVLNIVVRTYLNWPYLASQSIQFHTQPTHTHTHTHTHNLVKSLIRKQEKYSVDFTLSVEHSLSLCVIYATLFYLFKCLFSALKSQ